MQTFTVYAAKAMVYSLVFCGYYCFALRNKRFHYYNRFYLLMTVSLSLLLPFFHFNLWHWKSSNAQVVQLMNVVQSNQSETAIESKSFDYNWFDITTVFYFLIALYLLLALIFSVVAIFRLKRKYSVQKLHNVNFINTDLEQAPFSFFNNLFWKNTVSLTDDSGKQIFTHELTHIKQKHSWDKLFMRIVTSLFWFNPAYWFIQKELALIHEFIADEKAIENKSAEAFALMILQSKYAKNIFSPAQSFHYSPIKRRLLMLTTSKKPSFGYVRRMMVLPLFAISCILFAFTLQKEDSHTPFMHTSAPFVLVVDAGHGGTDDGATGNNVLEKDINLSIAKKVEELAPAYGITVKMTRTADETVSLQDRVAFIKQQQPNACISIHINSSGEKPTDKNEINVFVTRNEKQSSYQASRLLGSSLLQKVNKDFPVNNELLQSKQTGIYVLDQNIYPISLIECGYMNNPNNVKELMSNTKTEQLARDILEGVTAYANADKNKENALQTSSDTAKKPAPLYIVEGKEMSAEEVKKIDNSTIASVNVLKDTEATNKYGEKGKNGVVEIEFKKYKNQQPVVFFPSSEATNDKVDTITVPTFPGGNGEWIKYLIKNINSDVPAKNKAPKGKYTVVVSFTVAEDGTVSSVKADNNPGFGTAAEAVRVIQRGPKWIPAQQDGKNVVAKTKQAIKFEIADGR